MGYEDGSYRLQVNGNRRLRPKPTGRSLMNDNFDENAGPFRPGDSSESNGFDPRSRYSSRSAGHSQANGHQRAPVINFWVAVDLLAHRWGWIALGALLCTAGFFYLGSQMIKPKFTASAQLL